MLASFRLITITSLVVLLFSCQGEKPKNNKTVSFDVEKIKEYYIECETASFNGVYENYKENIYIPIKISYQGNTQVARMRIRGDTSRKDPKKSLKIKLDSALTKGFPTTLNLNAEYADKTYIRQYLSSKIMQYSGQACYDVEYVKVFVNGNFLGLYLQVENMDKDFLKRNDLSKKGNLYKATKDGACLSIFDDFDLKWEKKTNKKSDHNDLTKLIFDLNNIPDNEFENYIKTHFEYEKLINLLALNMFLSNSSTYYHNYYLYHDLYETGKWEMLPWDMDKTLSYYNWMPYTYHRTSSEWESDNPLVERSILCQPIFNDIKKRINELHQTHLNNKFITPVIDNLITSLQDVIPLDSLDQLNSINDWREYANTEKIYFDSHYNLLQSQFSNQPLSFNVSRFEKTQTDTITFKWNKSIHPADKKLSYILSYGTNFLLSDSANTNYITNITDTFFTLQQLLPEGEYYWKITAFDGEYYTDGFNTKNQFTVKHGTILPIKLTQNTTLIQRNSPYIIPNSLTIPPGVTLNIKQGVEIHLQQGAKIECSGNLIAKGTVKEPIKFIPSNSANDWDYIYLYSSCEKALFKHVLFAEGTINCKAKQFSLDSCTMLINKKDIGEHVGRNTLIYGNKSNMSIKNSSFVSSGFGEGMVLFYSEVITENCSFDNTPDAIEYIGVNKGIIRNNYVTNSPDDAIDLNACNNVLIEGNFLFNNIDKAISIGTEQYGASIKNIQIKNNLIVGNRTGIAIKDSSVAYISNNTLFKNYNGIYAYKKREGYLVGGTAYIKNTILEKNEKLNAYGDELSKIETKNTIVHNKVLDGENNFQGDPQFINASNNNFHLMTSSPCLKRGDNSEDIGAFNTNSTTVSFSEIHIKSKTEKKQTSWIKLMNNYNIPVDLSLYKLVITTSEKQKEFIFPIGTTLDRLSVLFITNNYTKFSSLTTHIIGGLPKITSNRTTLQLYNPTGILIDSYSYENILRNEEESIEFISNNINNTALKTWKIFTK